MERRTRRAPKNVLKNAMRAWRNKKGFTTSSGIQISRISVRPATQKKRSTRAVKKGDRVMVRQSQFGPVITTWVDEEPLTPGIWRKINAMLDQRTFQTGT